MAALGDGVGDYLRTASTFSTLVSAYSWAFWYLPTGAPLTGAVPSRHPFAFTNSTGATPGGYDVNFAWDHPNGSFYKSAVHRNADGSFVTAQHPGSPADTGWHHIAAVFNGTTLKLYYDGLEVASEAADPCSNVSGDPELTVCSYNNVTGYDDQAVAEMAIWSTALTAEQIYSISQGTPASSVNSGTVISYNRLNLGDITTTGNVLTNSGTVLNQTFFDTLTGGPAIGGEAMVSTVVYNTTLSGGLAIGGTDMISKAVYNLTPSGGLALGGASMVSPITYTLTLSGGLAIGGAAMQSPAIYHDILSGGLLIGGRSMDVFVMLGNGSFVMVENRGQAETKR